MTLSMERGDGGRGEGEWKRRVEGEEKDIGKGGRRETRRRVKKGGGEIEEGEWKRRVEG